MSDGRAFVRVWRYRIREEHRAEFERVYASDGDWARLFARADGYEGTRLLRDRTDPLRYLTLDRWRGEADWAAFRTDFAGEYAALDRRCADWTLEEDDLGDHDDTAGT